MSKTDKPTVAPTGTGEGLESTAHLYIPKAQYDAKVTELNAEYAALRSQLEEAQRINEIRKDDQVKWANKYSQANFRAEKAERDLATAQARIARLEMAMRDLLSYTSQIELLLYLHCDDSGKHDVVAGAEQALAAGEKK